MKKKVFLLVIFAFLAVLCGSGVFFNAKHIEVNALQISNLISEISTYDEFDTVTINKTISKQELLKKINEDKQKKNIETEQVVKTASLLSNEEMSYQDIVAVCEENDYFVLTTNYGYEIYYKFQLKSLVVDARLTNDFGAKASSTFEDIKILQFDTVEQTKYAYEEIEKQNIKVLADRIVKTSSIDNFTSGNFNSWGADAIDIDTYRNYYEISGTSKEVVVAVLDTGINTSHELFENRLLKNNGRIVGYCDSEISTTYTYSGYSFEDDNTHGTNSQGQLVETYTGHGTHVSGTIAELTPTNVKILPMKIFNYKGSGKFVDIVEALNYIVNNYSKYNIVAVNMSLGGLFDTASQADSWNETFDTVFNTLRTKKILPVVAAGNESTTTSLVSPGGCGDSAIVVSALKQTYAGYSFDSSYSNYGESVDISAPGTAIKSASIGTSATTADSNEYKTISGTSMATPHVSAAVALLCLDGRYYNNGVATYTASQIESRLFTMAIDKGTSGKDVYYGHGMLSLTDLNGNVEYDAESVNVVYDGNYHNIKVTVKNLANYTIYYGFTAETCSITDITTNDKFKNFTNGAIDVYFKIEADTFVTTMGKSALQITKASVGIKTLNQTFTYGNAINLNQTKYELISGTVYGDDDLNLTLSTSANNTSAVGNYDISASINNANYSLVQTKGKCVIDKRPINISLNEQTSIYGNDIVLDKTKYTVTSQLKVVNGDDLNLKITTDATKISEVGNYSINFVSANSNYQVTATAGTLKILERAIVISTQQAGYYGNDVVLDETDYSIISGLIVNNDDLNLKMTTDATKTSSVNTYEIYVTVNNKNYVVTTSDCYYSIYRRSIIIKPITQTSIYGNEVVLNQNAHEIENLANNDKIAVVLTTTATKLSPVGNYTISSSHTANAISQNYNITYKTGTLQILKRDITINATAQTSMYGDDVTLNQQYSVSGGIVNNDEINVSLSTTATKTSTIGDYDINVYVSGQDVDNYNIAKVAGVLTIVQRKIKIQLSNQEAAFNKEIILENLYEVVSEKKVVNNDELNVTAITNAKVGDPVGEYEISLTYNNSNYDIEIIKGVLYIRDRAVIITIEPQTFVYGNKIVLNQSKIKCDEDISSLGIVLHTTANEFSSVGSYEITASTTNSNIKLEFEVGELVINPRPLSVSIEDQTCEYGALAIDQTKFSLGEVVNNDDVDIELFTNATTNSGVGDYLISARTTNSNYALDFESGKFTISPKVLTISLFSQSLTYGNIALDNSKYSLSKQPIQGDNLNIVLKTDATNVSNVGDYDIWFEYDNENYSISGEKAVLSIVPRSVIISIKQASQYGSVIMLNESLFEVEENEIVNGDSLNLKLSTSANQASEVGNYDIVVMSQNKNYDVVVRSATLEIEPKPITITIQNQTFVYGSAINVDQTKYEMEEGTIINGDLINVTLFTEATITSNIGNYDIKATCSGADVDNYDITVVKGVLTISKRQITIKITNQEGAFGKPVILQRLFEVVSENKIVNNDELNIQLVTSANQASSVGDYPITLTYNNSNYEVSYIEGVYKVVEGDIVITILPQTFVYGEKIELNNLAFETNVDVDKTSLGITLSTNANNDSPAGNSYEINLQSCTNDNYEIVAIKGVLTIQPKDVYITINNQEMEYGSISLSQTEFSLSENVDAGVVLTCSANSYSPANNDYKIVADWTNKNYNIIARNEAYLSISPRDVEIKTIQTFVYGNSINLDNSNFTVTNGNIVNNEDLGIIFTSSAKRYDNVNTYSIDFTYSNLNYDVVLNDDSVLKIEPRHLDIGVEQNKYYGDDVNLSATDYKIISGSVVNNDNLNLLLSTTAKKSSPVGEYLIQLESSNSNYDITLKYGKLTVYKRLLYIEAIKYGEYGSTHYLNSDFTVVDGSLAFDTDDLQISFSTNATNVTPVGNYNISMDYNNENYDVELRPTSHFVVLPRAITLQIGKQSAVYGDNIIIDHNNYSVKTGSVVNQDSLNVTLSTDAKKGMNAGVYSIGGVCANANYLVEFISGEYEIQKRQITVKLKNQKKMRGITFELDQNAYEIVDGVIFGDDELDVKIYSNAKNFSMIGNYDLMAKCGNENYELNVVKGNLFLNVSFIDISVVVVVVAAIAIIAVKISKKEKAKKNNQKLFDKWIKW